MKKIFVCAAFAVLFGASVFAETNVSFTNKVTSDVVEVTIPNEGDTSAKFAGVKEKVTVEVTSEKVNASVAGAFVYSGSEESQQVAWSGEADWYVEYSPIDLLTVFWSDDIMTDGSYLPVVDDNVVVGNLGSDFGLLVKPVSGLRITGGMDFTSVFAGSDVHVDLNFGADYNIKDYVTVGLGFRDVAGKDDFSFGGFASVTAVKDLVVNIGGAYNSEAPTIFGDTAAIAGNLLTLGASYSFQDLSLGFDFATNFGVDFAYDIATAASVSYTINTVTLGLAGGTAMDFESVDVLKLPFVFAANPSVSVALGNHTLSVGVNVVNVNKVETVLTFPVMWKFAF